MGSLAIWFRRIAAALGARRCERELSDEIESHLDLHIADNLRVGLPPDEARRQALLKLGSLVTLREAHRAQRGLLRVETLLQDLRYGLRQMRRTPAITAVIVLSLALGIGANTAIFSLTNAVMLKSLPVTRPDELVIANWIEPWPKDVAQHGFTTGDDMYPNFSFPALQQFRAHTGGLFTAVAGVKDLSDVTVGIDGQPTLADLELVTGEFFGMLGIRPQIGRLFGAEAGIPADAGTVAAAAMDRTRVAVLSHAWWSREFGRDPRVLGKTITVGLSSFTIIGVAPAAFTGMRPGRPVDLWIPMADHPGLTLAGIARDGLSAFETPRRWWVMAIARLAPGVSEASARAGLDVLFQRTLPDSVRAAAPRTEPSGPAVPAGRAASLGPGAAGESAAEAPRLPHIVLLPAGKGFDLLRRGSARPLALISTIVGLVLLIACANVATLLLARATARRKEISVRLAIGASRGRVVRQLLTESVLLAGFGGALGLLLAFWLARALPSLLAAGTRDVPRIDAAPDPLVLVFTTAISLATGLLFGVAPALRATRVALAPSLKEIATVGAASDRVPRQWTARLLVIAQVAVSLLLLVGAGLFVRTLINIERQPLGFNPRNLLLFGLDGTQAGYRDAALTRLYDAVLERLRATPGVEHAMLSTETPMSGSSSNSRVDILDAADPAPHPMQLRFSLAGPRLVETMGMRLRLGRDFTTRDTAAAPRVAIISEAFAREAFGDAPPIGRRFRFIADVYKRAEFEVVGVVEEVKRVELQETPRPVAYLPYLQSPLPLSGMTVVVRTAVDPATVIPALDRAVHAVAPTLPLIHVTTQAAQIDESISRERTFARLSSAFGALALLLACIGLHGTMSYAVARRTPEIGVRLALGAPRGSILRMMWRDTLLIAIAGTAIGLVAALLTTRFLERWLFGLTPTDAVTLAVAALVLLAVTLVTGWLPARRASRVDPVTALR